RARPRAPLADRDDQDRAVPEARAEDEGPRVNRAASEARGAEAGTMSRRAAPPPRNGRNARDQKKRARVSERWTAAWRRARRGASISPARNARIAGAAASPVASAAAMPAPV